MRYATRLEKQPKAKRTFSPFTNVEGKKRMALSGLWRLDFRAFDAILLVVTLAIMFFGWIMVGSASVAYSEHQFGNIWHYSFKHGVFLFLAIFILLWFSKVSSEFWHNISHWLLLGAFILLALVLIFGIEINGSKRWLYFGLFNVQASEVAKIFLVIYSASYLTRHLKGVRSRLIDYIKPFFILTLMGYLLIEEPDYGALVVMVAAVLGMLFLAGVRISYFFVSALLILLALWLVAIAEPYRIERLSNFINPWANEFDSGYQLTQSLIAFGRGHWFGLGLGNSIQKLFYLPEAHTDFVFAIVAEELGFVGCAFLLLMFGILVWRILHIGRRAELKENFYSAYLCYGIGILFAAQIIINIGVNVGILPTKGLTLPLFSYGGSSLLTHAFMLALVLRISIENRITKPEN